jgi:hypothetical protein
MLGIGDHVPRLIKAGYDRAFSIGDLSMERSGS